MERSERLQVGAIALGVTFILLFTVLLQLILGVAVARFAPHVVETAWFRMLGSTLPMYACAIPLSLLFFGFAKAEPPQKRSIGFGAIFGLCAICFALTYFGNFIGALVNTARGAENTMQQLTLESPLWANLLFCGILAPIMEELVWRKLIIDRLRRYGDLFAILTSGLLFGLIHGNFGQFFYAAMVGIVLGGVYLYTGKLRYTVGLHMALNLVGGVYATEMTKLLQPLSMLSAEELAATADALLAQHAPALAMLGGYVLLAAVMTLSAPVAVVMMRRYVKFEGKRVDLSAAGFCRVFLINPAVWLLLAVLIWLFL